MDTVKVDLDQDEDFFLMSNVHPKDTGLPFFVWFSEKQGRHDVRVKVAEGPRAQPHVATLSVRSEVKILDGDLNSRDFELVRQWIELNRDVIIGYWDRTIESTKDALEALQPLPKP